jgi:hypothetical protein
MLNINVKNREKLARSGFKELSHAGDNVLGTPKYAEMHQYISRLFKISAPEYTAAQIIFADFRPVPVGPLTAYTTPVHLLDGPDIGVVMARAFYDVLEPKEIAALLVQPIQDKYLPTFLPECTGEALTCSFLSPSGLNREESTAGVAIMFGILAARASGVIGNSVPEPLTLTSEPTLSHPNKMNRRKWLGMMGTAAASVFGGSFGYKNGTPQAEIDQKVQNLQDRVTHSNEITARHEEFLDYSLLFDHTQRNHAWDKMKVLYPNYTRPEPREAVVFDPQTMW